MSDCIKVQRPQADRLVLVSGWGAKEYMRIFGLFAVGLLVLMATQLVENDRLRNGVGVVGVTIMLIIIGFFLYGFRSRWIFDKTTRQLTLETKQLWRILRKQVAFDDIEKIETACTDEEEIREIMGIEESRLTYSECFLRVILKSGQTIYFEAERSIPPHESQQLKGLIGEMLG